MPDEHLKITLKALSEEARARLAAIVNSSDDAIIGKTLEGIITTWNPGAERVFGYSAAEAIGQPMLMLFPPERLKEEPEILARIGRGERVDHFETVRIRKDGRRIDVSATISPIVDDHGKIIGASKITRDITERKRVEESRSRLAEIVQGMNEACFALDKDWRFVFVNDRCESLLRHRRDEMLGNLFWTVFAKLLGTPMEQNYRRAMTEHVSVAFEAWSPVAQRWLDIRLFPSGDGLAAFLLDIDARKQVEEALKTAHAQLRQLLEHSPAVIYSLKIEGQKIIPTVVSENMTALLGFTVQEALSYEWWHSHLHPEDRDRAVAGISVTMTQGVSVTEYRMRHKNGSYRWVEDTRRVIRDSSNQPDYFVGLWSDITERKRAEDVLHQTTRKDAIRGKHAIIKELGVIFAVGAVIVGILAYTNALQPVANAFVSKYQDHYDDVFSICGVVLAGFFVFSYRRWQEARKRMGRQANIEEALRILQTELEKRIRQRTAELAQANEALRSEITERQRVGEAQARLAAIVDSSEDAIIGKTLEGTIVSWNHGAEKVFGYSSAEAIGKPLLMLFPPERLKEEPEILARITRGEMVQHFETVRVRKDGRRIDVSATISPIFDDKGKIIGASKIARDITEHKEAEVKLRESEEIFATAFRSSPAGIALLTLDGRYLEVNAVYSSMLGYTREEMIGQTSISLNLTTAAERERVMLEFEHQDSSKKAHEMKLRRRDGSFADVLFTNAVMPLHGVPHRLGTIIDITARRRAEIRVQHLNRVYAVLSDINQTIVREKDSQALLEATCRIAVEKGEFRMAWVGVLDDAAQKVKPVASAGMVDGYLEVQSWDLQDESRKRGPTAWALLTGERRVCNDIEHDPDVLPWREAALQRGYRSSVAFPLKADGRVVGVFSLCSAEPDFFDEEELVLLDELAADIGFAMEVHEHEKERLAAEQESHWRTTLSEAVLNSTQDGILVVDTQGKKLVQNQRMKDIWKIPAEIFNEPDDVEQLRFVRSQIKNWQQFSDKVKHLYARPEEISIDEIELVDGRTLDRYSSPVRDREGKYYGRVWAFRDITEQRKLAEQLRQAQKMEAIGQLAGGVSHDFNNILAVIQMQADQLKFGKNLLPEHKELADEIAAAAQRAAALTRQLLLFSRKETLRQQDLDLNNSINNMAKMLRRTIGENVQMQFRFAMETLLVHADAGMIDQVLMNLAVNSRDAMPKGGKLVIETSVVEFNEQAVSQSAQTRPGSFICLAVSDTGCGIPPENLSRIFEPFFTTKGVGKGTGLGLATVFGIVQQHQGWINVYSEVGRGTTFRIYLPRLAKKSTQKSEADSTVSLPGGHETILLVEDDPFLRASIRKTLLQLGYRVFEAVSGIEALEIWTQHKHEIHLLLTDLVMPGGITGIDLGEQLLKDHPGLKVIYASGYAAEVAGKDFPLEEGVNFVTKPFSSARLAQTIRARLDS